MSSYIHFFVRRNDTFIPIGTFGRSTRIYAAFEHMAPWERIRALNTDLLKFARAYLKSEEEINREIDAAHARINTIAAFNNGVDEKMAAIDEVREEIKGWQEFAHEEREARAFIGFLYGILDEAEYNSLEGFGASACLYVGMECGSDVSVKDIAE